MQFFNHREMNRRERSHKELNEMCMAYDGRCHTVHTFNYNDLTPAQKRAFNRREPSKNYLEANQ